MATDSRPTFLVIYRPGEAWIDGLPVQQQPLEDHGRFLLGLYAKGTLRFAGPFSDDAGGAAVIVADNLATASTIIMTDPAVVAKVIVPELHLWALVPWERHLKA
jgi:uncharacterized protein